MSRIRRLHGGRDRLRARGWNALVDSHERNVLAPHSEPYMIGGTPVGRHIEQLPMRGHRFNRMRGNDPDTFIGTLTNVGPNSEADYEDERYWVREVAFTNDATGDSTEQASLKYVTDGKWITATNLAEIYNTGTSGRLAGSHGLTYNADNRIFEVWPLWDNRSGQKVKHYVFYLPLAAYLDWRGTTFTISSTSYAAIDFGGAPYYETKGALEQGSGPSTTTLQVNRTGRYYLYYTVSFRTLHTASSFGATAAIFDLYNVDASSYYGLACRADTYRHYDPDIGLDNAYRYAIVSRMGLAQISSSQGQVQLRVMKVGASSTADGETAYIQLTVWRAE